MTGLSMLWLPILVSAILVFVASSVIHMATPWHKADYRKIPNEDQAMDALRPLAIAPGDYMTPFCNDMKEMKSAEFIATGQRSGHGHDRHAERADLHGCEPRSMVHLQS